MANSSTQPPYATLATWQAIIHSQEQLGYSIPQTQRSTQPHNVFRTRWINNSEPKHISFGAHGSEVATCLLLSQNRTISAAANSTIYVYSPATGQLLQSLVGHEGGVWALSAIKDTLVSSSTDRTVRIWNLSTGQCTHVFRGHTGTVRCLAVVKPEWIDVQDENGVVTKQIWPKRRLIVTGSRDRPYGFGLFLEQEKRSTTVPRRLHLEGHDNAIRALAARGRTLVSASYDCTLRAWDIVKGTCKWVLTGHTDKVYSVFIDPVRNRACSSSMDSTVRIWSLETGQSLFTLTGHTSLVGLLGLSPSYLVSAAADSTLRIWNPDTGELIRTLAGHTGAITCFQHDEVKVVSGSDGTIRVWDISDGTVVRDILTGTQGIYNITFEGRWCVASSDRGDSTFLDVWDFGDGDDNWVHDEDGLSEDE